MPIGGERVDGGRKRGRATSMQPADLREKESRSPARPHRSDRPVAARRPNGRRPSGRPPARGSRRPPEPTPIGRLPRVLLAGILVVLLIGVARATDVLALV